MQYHKKVIPFWQVAGGESHQIWRFFDYCESGRNVIEPWYQALLEDGQETLDAILKQNAKTPLPMNWGCSKVLQGEYKQEGIWEWKFFANGKQQRLLGMFGNNRREAIFLIGCSHKSRVYTPHDCLDTALRRAKEARKGAQVDERTVEQTL